MPKVSKANAEKVQDIGIGSISSEHQAAAVNAVIEANIAAMQDA